MEELGARGYPKEATRSEDDKKRGGAYLRRGIFSDFEGKWVPRWRPKSIKSQ